MASNEHETGHHGVGHQAPLKILILTGLALLVLTWLTVAAAKVDLGEANIYVALGIAVVKGGLVALFFMHLWWDRPFNAIVFVGSIAFVALFLAFAMTDTRAYRGDIEAFRAVEGQDSIAVRQEIESLGLEAAP